MIDLDEKMSALCATKHGQEDCPLRKTFQFKRINETQHHSSRL